MAGNQLGALKAKLGLQGQTKPGEMITRMNALKTPNPVQYKSTSAMPSMKCKSCGAMYKSKAALTSHIANTHTMSGMKKKAKGAIKTTGTFKGKSNKLGHGGRAAQLKARGVPGGVIGNLARAAHAAPGMKNYHPSKK